ncbi:MULTISPECIES: BON domain-containing protein [Serratia]|uniref:Osmotically-inducible protein Y n=2 Tax=Serratia odorifera TaxID=618 RepID=D4E5U1_SEROD|nr:MULTISPECIES: BON domain-containing protein [Serratia]EFE94670.1 phospholipid-binding domain protein [Serratia odorifera DSM 4582]MBJ2067596.1 BON domain-containing protein [Serratia odorifera]MCS3408519.1 BON domain-containing protein [Serratia sp. AKBS12]PNK89614.1 BON domain-containing protein [Serratia odorifera]RII70802.1 BON domain-containing protein [Serratia odorifera]
MKLFKTLSALCAAAVMAMAVSACAPTATSEGTGGYIDDTVVTTKVKSALLADKSIKSTEISVETFKGRVQLSGFVSSSADANRAVQVTRGVAGVKSVENVMQVK